MKSLPSSIPGAPERASPHSEPPGKGAPNCSGVPENAAKAKKETERKLAIAERQVPKSLMGAMTSGGALRLRAVAAHAAAQQAGSAP